MRALLLLAAVLIGLGAPVHAADDVAAAQSVIRSQVEAFDGDDAAAAYSYAAPEIQGMFPQADIFLAWCSEATPRFTVTKALNLARPVSPPARSRSAFTSSMRMVKRGRRSTRWSESPM